MKLNGLSRRLDVLSSKFADEPKERIARLDVSSFSDAEIALLSGLDDLREQYEGPMSAEALEANNALISKAYEIYLKYTIGTLKHLVLGVFGHPKDKVDSWYFDLYLYNFLSELTRVLKAVHEWSASDRAEFVEFLEKSGMENLFFEIPRKTRLGVAGEKTKDSEVNQHEL